MPKQLSISFGQYTNKGVKAINQDFHGVATPASSLLANKGIAIALADGISSSQVSQEASSASVHALMDDYYSTSQAWSVKTSAHKVLNATNSWLYGQTRRSQYRSDMNKGYVCTLSAMILKSTTAHLFHVGDSRIYRLRDAQLEQLTTDHSIHLSEHEHYLSRAMGVHPHLEMDYQTFNMNIGDVFLLMTDGVYEHISDSFIQSSIHEYSQTLEQAAQVLVQQALHNGSQDNLTAQIVRIDELPIQSETELFEQLTQLPFPPPLDTGSTLDQWKIIRPLHITHRSHIFLARNINDPDEQVVIKILSVEQQKETDYLDRFLMEDWIAQRIDNPHVMKSPKQAKKQFIYSIMEYIPGRTLSQWMQDNPKPDLETVRKIIEQIAKGLQAFHRLEMLHQDCRPENILIDASGQVKLIDFGSAKVAGILEIDSPLLRMQSLGTVQFMAPEYFMGEGGSQASDIFSLGVMAYQMLKGQLPYGDEVARCTNRSAQLKLKYRSVLDDKRDLPLWLDVVLKKAVHVQPHLRYQTLSEFVYDLRHPTEKMLNQAKGPLLERNPVAFWQGVSTILFLTVIYLLFF